MKLRRLLTLATVATLLWTDAQGAGLVFAESQTQAKTIVATDNTAIKAQYQARLEKEEIVLSFQPEGQLNIEKISAQLNQQRDGEKLDFTEVSTGQYELRLPKEQITSEDKLEILVETRLKEFYRFDNLSIEGTGKANLTGSSANSSPETTSESLTTTVLATSETTTFAEVTTSEPTTSEATTSETTEEPQLSATKKKVAESQKAGISVQAQSKTGDFDIKISNVPKTGIKTVQVPVWSDDKGQDDLKWYTAVKQSDGSYKVSVKISQHKYSTGKYHIHLYYLQNNGKKVGVTATTTTVKIPKPTGNLKIEQNESGKVEYFDVIVSNVSSPAGLKKVKVPVWSEEKGQDDLKWYVAQKQSDGSYRVRVSIKDHKSNYGNYHVHLYYEQGNGQTVGVTSTKTRLNVPKPSGKLSIQNQNSQAGSFDVVLTKISAALPISHVYFPIWTEKNGQDDIKWYSAKKQADGSFKASVQISQHQNRYGTYLIHCYYKLSNGQMVGVTASSTKLVEKKAKIVSKAGENNQQIFTISNVDSGMDKLQLAVWTNSKGQDDLNWYDASKQKDGSYQVAVPLKNHNFETGQYSAHLYGTYQNQQSFLGESNFSVSSIAAIEPTTVNVLAVNSLQGTLNVAVNEPINSKKIKEIRVAAWSDSDQTNLAWYTTNPTGNLTNINVSVSRHYFQTGNYTVHAYISYTDGTTRGFNLGNYYLQGPTGNASKILILASSMMGVRGGSSEHQKLVDDYNRVTPRPVGYVAKYSDDWCDIFVTTIFQRAGLSVLIGRECGVERHIQIFKTLGIWIEDGTVTPKQGDIITFNWDSTRQPNNGFADHIGIVEYVENGYIHTIEGNGYNQVVRRSYPIGQGNIRGFARPRY